MSEIALNTKPVPTQKYVGVRFTGKTGQRVATGIANETYIPGGNTDMEYIFRRDIEVEIGDLVVCDCGTGFAVGVVTRLTCGDIIPKRWMVQKIDIETHKIRLENDARRKAIRAKMDDRRKQLEDEALYRMMAERDPEMAELIKEYYGV